MLTQIFNRYSYCLNNPLKYVDPSGESWLYGWFENELTGDLYYDRDLGRGQEYLIDGNGWNFLGENNMFGTSPDKLFYSNYNMAEIYAGSEFGLARAAFKGKNAVTFMEKMGYKQVDKQQFVYDKSANEPIGAGPYKNNYITGELVVIGEKKAYVPNDYQVIKESREYLTPPRNYVSKSFYPGLIYIYRQNLNYDRPTSVPALQRLILSLDSNLNRDSRKPNYYPSWDSYPKGVNPIIEIHRLK